MRQRLKLVFQKVLTPFILWLVKIKLSPHLITGFGLILNFFAAGLILKKFLRFGGVVVLVGGIFDLLDGALARTTNSASPKGAFLDSVADRISEGAIFLSLSVYFFNQHQLFLAILGILCLIGSYLVSYLRARAEGLGYQCQIGWFTRFERILVLSLFLIFRRIDFGLWMIAFFTYLTVFQRFIYVWRK